MGHHISRSQGDHFSLDSRMRGLCLSVATVANVFLKLTFLPVVAKSLPLSLEPMSKIDREKALLKYRSLFLVTMICVRLSIMDMHVEALVLLKI